MCLEELTKLTEFVSNSKRSIDEITKFLVMQTFGKYAPIGIYVGEIRSNGNLRLRSSFGFENSAVKPWVEIPLTSNLPIIDSIHRDEVIFQVNSDDFYVKYPELKEPKVIDRIWSTCIACPTQSLGAYYLLLQGAPKRSEQFDSLLRSVGHLIALHLAIPPTLLPQAAQMSNHSLELTPRQGLIKELLSKGFTNSYIAQEIGYSESLVRQETIAIYATLRISGRHELIKVAKVQVSEGASNPDEEGQR